jgi:hypothetical protein
MAWVAVDRAVRIIQEFKEDGPLERWIRLRSDIHDEICLGNHLKPGHTLSLQNRPKEATQNTS